VLVSKDDIDGSTSEYRAALRLKPDLGEAHRGLGANFFSKGDIDEAAIEYNEAVRLMPDDPVAHDGLAAALFRKGDVDGAISEYRAAQRLKPDDVEANSGIGMALLRKGAAEQAIDQFKKTIAAAPNNPRGYQMLAGAYEYLYRNDDALEVLQQVEKISPGDPDTSRGMGMILLEEKRYAEAIAKLRPAVERNPNVAPLAFTLGAAYARSGDGDNAVAAFQKALEIFPDPSELNSVGYELADANVRLDDALRYSEQAVEQQENATTTIDLATLTIPDLRKMPTLAAFWDSVGWAHFRLGHMGEAEKYLKASWNLDQIPVVGDHLGQVYEKAGEKQKAIDSYALTLATNHAPPETRSKLEALLGNKARADEAVRSALGKLGEQRTKAVPRVAKGRASAEFFILFREGSVTGVKFVSGSDELQSATKVLSFATYDVPLPNDERSVRLVRRGILDCPATGTTCQFVMLLPDTVSSLN